MAKNVLEWTLVANDRASDSFQRAGRSAADLEKTIGRAGFAIGAALAGAAIAVGKFAADSVEAYAEAEQAQNRLNFAFDKFPALVDGNVDALRKLNTELQKKTRFEDDSIAASQGVLAQYDLTADQLTELTPLMLDYAAATGKDVNTAAEDLGKALLGQGRALKAVGIDFQDAGTPAANYAQIISGLTEKVKGFAEQDAQTLAGRLDVIKNQFGDIQEKVGEALAPGLVVASDIISDTLLPKLDQVVDRVGPRIAEGIAEIAPRLEDAVDKSLPALERLLEGLPGFVGAVSDSVVADLETFDRGQQVFEEVDGFFNEYLPKWAQGMIPVEESWEGFFNWWDMAWDGQADNVKNKSDEIKRYWSTTIYDMKTTVYAAGMQTAGWEFAQGFADGITSNIEAATLAAERMALAARDKVRNTMQIQSPSRVMAELGGYVSEGFAQGITDGIPMVASAAGAMTGIGVAAPSFGAVQSAGAGYAGGGFTVNVNVGGNVLGTDASIAQVVTSSLISAARAGQFNPQELNRTLGN